MMKHVIWIVFATHGPLGAALLETATAIAGVRERVTACGLAATQAPDRFQAQLDHCLAACADAPVLILCDLGNGTPHNCARRSAQRRPNTRVLTGVNLAMTLEAWLTTELSDVDQLLAQVLAAGLSDVME
jgi:PTS system mannose-specific IIA component